MKWRARRAIVLQREINAPSPPKLARGRHVISRTLLRHSIIARAARAALPRTSAGRAHKTQYGHGSRPWPREICARYRIKLARACLRAGACHRLRERNISSCAAPKCRRNLMALAATAQHHIFAVTSASPATPQCRACIAAHLSDEGYKNLIVRSGGNNRRRGFRNF